MRSLGRVSFFVILQDMFSTDNLRADQTCH